MAEAQIDQLFLACVGPGGRFGEEELRHVLASTGSDGLSDGELADMLVSLDVDGAWPAGRFCDCVSCCMHACAPP